MVIAKEGVGERGRKKECSEVREGGRGRHNSVSGLICVLPRKQSQSPAPFTFLRLVSFGILLFEIENVSTNILFQIVGVFFPDRKCA